MSFISHWYSALFIFIFFENQLNFFFETKLTVVYLLFIPLLLLLLLWSQTKKINRVFLGTSPILPPTFFIIPYQSFLFLGNNSSNKSVVQLSNLLCQWNYQHLTPFLGNESFFLPRWPCLFSPVSMMLAALWLTPDWHFHLSLVKTHGEY